MVNKKLPGLLLLMQLQILEGVLNLVLNHLSQSLD